MTQNINRSNRETHMEHHKSVHKPWLYLNRFQSKANRMKKLKIVQKTLISDVIKIATQKRSTYLEKGKKILRNDINGI